MINRELAKTKWFPLLVEKWWWHIDGEIEDCMGYITGVWEKKEEKPQIMRMEIVLSEEKAKLHGIDVNKGYKAIDDYFENPKKYEENIPKYKTLISQCTYRQYTTGFFFGKPDETTQIYGCNVYERDYVYLGISGEPLEDGSFVIEQKNKFCVGDKIEIMKADGRDIEANVISITDQDGVAMESCPHPKQIITIKLDQVPEAGDILRMKAE